MDPRSGWETCKFRTAESDTMSPWNESIGPFGSEVSSSLEHEAFIQGIDGENGARDEKAGSAECEK